MALVLFRSIFQPRSCSSEIISRRRRFWHEHQVAERLRFFVCTENGDREGRRFFVDRIAS
jgi:hypothetical protein